MKSNTLPKSPKGCIQILRDQMWGAIGAIAGILSLIVALLALPQATPIRTSISEVISGTSKPPQIATPMPSPTEPKVAPAKTFSANFVLSCGKSCENPLVATIISIKIEPLNNRMVWTLILKNTSEFTIKANFDEFSLQSSLNVKPINASGDIRSSIPPTLNSDEELETTATFNFIPYMDTTYTLKARFTPNAGDPEVRFSPILFSFNSQTEQVDGKE